MQTAIVTTAAPVDARVELTFARKGSARTHWIEGEYPVDARPAALFAAFEAAGWHLDSATESIPAYQPFDFDDTRPLGQRATLRDYQVKDFVLTKSGTDLFAGWTAEEERENLREARALLRRFGFARVPVWAKTWQDLT